MFISFTGVVSARDLGNYELGSIVHPSKKKFSLTPIADQIKTNSIGRWQMDSDHDKIPDSVEKAGYSVYTQIIGSYTWHDALSDAISRGGFLATVPTKEAHYKILSIIKDRKSSWLGGHDQTKQNRWEWITGEKWSFSKWAKGEPNNYGGPEDGLILSFGKDREYWNDGKVSTRCSYILEKVYKTNPFLADSDGDGFQDLVEIKNGFDPNDSNSRPYNNYILP
jgi:hypothetical protein